MANVREWMDNKTILLTGGAGFFGKVLTEKLLRCCPGVKKIYVIIRSKGSLKAEERWAAIIKNELFKILLAAQPNVMEEKLVVLNGDMSQINLGLSQDILEELQKTVNVIFHAAATVRFNDPLHKAVLANTRGTLEICKLASRMENIECFVHVSTTYCHYNLNKSYYEEKVYEPCQAWRTVIKLVETERPEVMNIICQKIIQNHPNTYTFTKSLSEKIVEEYSSHIPVVIVRPCVVVGMLKDPLPGWTDNLNGVIGVTSGVCKSVIRVMKGDRHCALDYISVDTAINALIICAWDKAISENKKLSIYNCAYSNFKKIDFDYLTKTGLVLNKEITLANDLWYPFIYFTTNDFYYHILYYVLHVIPAAFVDLTLFLLKKKVMLMKITIKIYLAIQALSSFTMKSVTFDNTNFLALWDRMAAEDTEIFTVKPPIEIDDLSVGEFFEILHKGVKIYYFKESMEDNEYHRKKQQRLFYLDRFVRVIVMAGFFMLFFWIIQAMW